MSVTKFLLRLFGRHPEQVEEQERFEENMRELDKRRVELDSLLDGIREVGQAVRDKSIVLVTTANSLRPGSRKYESEESA